MTRWAMFVASGTIPIQILAEPWAPGASMTDAALRDGVNAISLFTWRGSKARRELPTCGSGLGFSANRALLSPSCDRPSAGKSFIMRSTRRSRPYKVLMPSSTNQYGNLTRLGAKDRSGKEAIMLDVAFVALGFAVLALMGVYAVALRQL
jgi:hypothetical protein